MRRILGIFLSVFMVCGTILPAHAASADLPSAWAQEEITRAIALGFVPTELRGDWQQNITRAEYAKLMMYFLSVQYHYAAAQSVLRESWKNSVSDDSLCSFVTDYCRARTDRNGNPFFSEEDAPDPYGEDAPMYIGLWYSFCGLGLYFSDVEDSDSSWYVSSAYAFGLVNGRSDTTYDPFGSITRQEAASMLMRAYRNYGGIVPDAAVAASFADATSISDWAWQDVEDISCLGVMQGMGDNLFVPLEGYTREQAVVTFLRLYENAPVSRQNGNILPLCSYEDELNTITYWNLGVFVAEEQIETSYGTVLNGYYSQRHDTGPNYRMYFLYQGGGYVHVLPVVMGRYDRYPFTDLVLSDDCTQLYFTHEMAESFQYMNTLFDTDHLWPAGVYRFTLDLNTGVICNVAAVA